jgi:hypothetical protein
MSGTLQDLPMVVVPVVAAVAALVYDRRRRLRAAETGAAGAAPVSGDQTAWLYLLAGTSFVAAVIHAVVCPEHFQEYWAFGTFFLATAVAGMAYAVWVLARPARWLFAAGVVANLGIVLLWLTTRLVEVPIGPDAGETEAFGTLDIVASSAEMLAFVAAVVLLRRSLATAASPRSRMVRRAA